MAHPLVLVTGASKGLGLAVADTLLRLGASVLAISRTRTPELEQLSKQNADSLFLRECDIADESTFRSELARIETTYGHLDALVLNAGTLDPLARLDSPRSTAEAWKAHFDVNLFSCVTALQATIPALRRSESGGKVIFVSSGAATGGVPGWAPYNASKAALNSLCRTLANEEPDITAVAVRPGKVDTAMQAEIRARGNTSMTQKDHASFIQVHQDGKLVKPEDAGYVIAALALRAPKELSGQFVSWDSKECEPFRRPA